MAVENITWGEERIAHELLVKLGVRVSPRTVRKYIPIRDDGSPDRRNASHRWATFVRNHAKAVVAADFFNVVTVSFRVLYVFVIMEIGTRKMLPFNVTAHPTAEWTLQQFREAIGCEHDYRFVIVDRDGKFSADLGVVAPLWLRAKCASCSGRGMFDHEVSQAQPVQAREAEEVPRSQLGGIQRRAAPPRRFDGLV